MEPNPEMRAELESSLQDAVNAGQLRVHAGTSEGTGLETASVGLVTAAQAAHWFAPAPTVAEFLLKHPEHRHIARRAQIAAQLAYAEIRDNTIDASVMPIDMLRMKLSFFGACHFDPRSDRWVRINMYQNAPFPEDLARNAADDWTLPRLPEVGE